MTQHLREYILSTLALATGLILFLIGVFGVMGTHLDVNPFLTVLFEPLRWGDQIDKFYFILLTALGGWLVMSFHVRVPAAIALGLVLGKIVLVGHMFHLGTLLPLALSINLFLLLFRFVTNRRWFASEDQANAEHQVW